MSAFNTAEDDKFKSISEFKDCINRGGEICFIFKDTTYGVFAEDSRVNICDINNPDDDQWFDTADKLLDLLFDGKKLREIITQIEVTYRTI